MLKRFIYIPGEPEIVPTPQTTPTTLRCEWSGWLSSSTPTFDLNSGDFETILGLKTMYGLCKDVERIECRMKDSRHTPFELTGQVDVTCDVNNGLRCYNRDQPDAKCYDYEVRILCWNDAVCE